MMPGRESLTFECMRQCELRLYAMGTAKRAYEDRDVCMCVCVCERARVYGEGRRDKRKEKGVSVRVG